MQTTTGEDAPPQFTRTTAVTVNGRQLGETDAQPIDDPFATTVSTVVIGEEDLRDALSSDEGTLHIIVINTIGGTRAALRHVFQPIDLSPNDEQPATSGAVAAASTQE